MDASAYIDVKPNRNIPAFRVGDTIRVHATVVEGERRRIQAFEGVVIRIKRGGVNSAFTVRRVSHGVGIERVFPFFSPLIDKVEVTRVGKVRRGRLYFLRERIGKAARLKPGARARFELLTSQAFTPEEEEVEEPAEEEVLEEGEAEVTEEATAEGEAEAEAAAEPEAAEEPAVEAAAEPEAAEPEAAEEPPAEEPAAEEPEAPAEASTDEPAAEAADDK